MTTLRLHNTLSRTKEPFVPLDPENVRMYVCGPTVYDYAHIGNARPAIVFDVLFRLLRHLYGADHVTYVRNITDIDDKINARALEMQAAEPATPILDIVRRLTDETAKVYQADMAALGNLSPTNEPRATRHIPQMIAMIAALIEAGHAYPAEGHVLYDVSSKADYGKLAGRSVDDMIAGARIDPAPYKKSPMDFVLWKPSDAQTPGWESPWGFGRPGWHLECSAMSAEYLGDTFDIHGGGIDLVFPHHENEIAQSEGAHHNHPLARYWMHNGHLQVEGAKMSKSLGNFVTVHDLLKKKKFGGRKWDGDVIRFAMLSTHYRQPIDWSVDLLEQSEARLEKWRAFAADRTDSRENQSAFSEVLDALQDDLNTPMAFAHIDRIISQTSDEARDRYTVYKLLRLMGMKGPTSRTLKLAKKVEDLAKAFAKFSENDWNSLVANVERSPLLRGGEPKSATNLIIYTSILRDALDRVSKITNQIEQIPEIGDRKARVSNTFTSYDSKDAWIVRLIEARNAARAAKNFTESDRIRDELLAKGIVLKDSKDGTTWEVKR